MTMQQWDMHKMHVDEHIMWPATKAEILKACNGSDVEKDILGEIRNKLADGSKMYTKQEFKNLMVN